MIPKKLDQKKPVFIISIEQKATDGAVKKFPSVDVEHKSLNALKCKFFLNILFLLLAVWLSICLVTFRKSIVHWTSTVVPFKIPDGNRSSELLVYPLGLKFLTPVNRTRLHDSEYHIITITHHEVNETFILHLKKSGATILVEDTEIFDEKMDCVYTGKIVSAGKGEYVGMASLSSCHHEIALEGLITLRGLHYQLTPAPNLLPPELHDRLERSSVKSSKHVVPHQIKTPKSSASSSYRRGDSKRVPPDLLRKAREKMLKDQESLEDEDDDEENSLSGSLQKTFSNLDDDLDFDTFSHPVSHEELEETPFAQQIRRTPKGNRQTKVIELAIFTDPVFYEKWAAEYPKDTDIRINQFLLALVNNMNYLYNQPSMKQRITFRLVQIKNLKTNPAGLKVTPSADKYLDSFCNWAGKQDTNGAIWDHAMMISGYDLLDEAGTTGNLGVAFTSTMCLQYYSCSLIEYVRGFETAYTAAHEVGHSLGMLHDGEDFNRKCDDSKYLMAALAGSGQVTWSECSNQNVQQFFATGDPQPGTKNINYVPRCLMKKGSRRNSVLYRRGKFPGELFDIREQCQKICDGCVPYVTSASPYNNICWMLHCSSPSSSIIGAHPALEGTSCGRNKRCRAGRCVV